MGAGGMVAVFVAGLAAGLALGAPVAWLWVLARVERVRAVERERADRRIRRYRQSARWGGAR